MYDYHDPMTRDDPSGEQRQYNQYTAQREQFDPGTDPNNTVRSGRPNKTGGAGKRVAALALVCALMGGVAGGTAAGLAAGSLGAVKPESSVTETAYETENAESRSNIHATVLNVTTEGTEAAMTPQEVYAQNVDAVVAVYNESTVDYYGQTVTSASSGSGFLISQDGYILTNNHVVEGAETLTVTLTSGEEYEAELIGTDAENDVALIKIDGTDLPAVSIGDSDAIQVGEEICAIGNPLGTLTNTLTVGYVSALDREINENGIPISMFQTDCVINSGNSGGPMFDMSGNVIGITTAKYSSSGSSASAAIEGIGFCIPINDAMEIAADLLQYGYVTGRASLGIAAENISSTVTQYYNLPGGAYVYSVQEGSAAAEAGLEAGDIITAVEGQEIASVSELRAELKRYSAGETVTMEVYRTQTGETLTLPVTLDEKTAA